MASILQIWTIAFSWVKKLIVIIYVDNTLVYARDSKDTDDLIKKLQIDNIIFCQEDTAEGYFRIKAKRDGSKTTLSRPGSVKWVVEAQGLCDKYCTEFSTPAECIVLTRDLID